MRFMKENKQERYLSALALKSSGYSMQYENSNMRDI